MVMEQIMLGNFAYVPSKLTMENVGWIKSHESGVHEEAAS